MVIWFVTNISYPPTDFVVLEEYLYDTIKTKLTMHLHRVTKFTCSSCLWLHLAKLSINLALVHQAEHGVKER